MRAQRHTEEQIWYRDRDMAIKRTIRISEG
jgi:hypothetical protein